MEAVVPMEIPKAEETAVTAPAPAPAPPLTVVRACCRLCTAAFHHA